jgi:hypothetical protein
MAILHRRYQPALAFRSTARHRTTAEAAELERVDVHALTTLVSYNSADAAVQRQRPLDASTVMALQRTHGNAYVQRLIARQTAPAVQRQGTKAPVNTPPWKAEHAQVMHAHSRFWEEFKRAESFLERWRGWSSGDSDDHAGFWTYVVDTLGNALENYKELYKAVHETYSDFNDLLLLREYLEKKNERRGETADPIALGAIDEELTLIQTELEPLDKEFADFVLTWCSELARLLDRPPTKAPRRSSLRGAKNADDPAIESQLHEVLRHLRKFGSDSEMVSRRVSDWEMVWSRVSWVRSKIKQLDPQLRRMY